MYIGYYGVVPNGKTNLDGSVEQAETPQHNLKCDAKNKSSLTQVFTETLDQPMNDFYGFVMVGTWM